MKTVSLGGLTKEPGQYGVGLSSREWRTGDPRYIRITDIRDDGSLNAAVVAPDGEPTEWKKALLRKDDLLFARSGATVGKTYIHRDESSPAVYAGYLIRFSIDQQRALPSYVFHYTRSQAYRSWVASTQRAVAQPNINAKQFANLPIPLPSLDEQHRIVAILDRVDRLRSLRRQTIVSLEEIPQARFREMFGRSTDNSSAVLPLEGWVNPARPITYGILKPGDDVLGGIPYVRVADMRDGGIRVDGVRRTTARIATAYRRSRLVAGDLLISIRGHVGRCAFVPSELNGGNITQDSARLAIANPESAVYVRCALESPSLQQWMARRIKGAAVRGINLGDLKLAPIPQPPMSAQVKFAESVMSALSLVAAARRESQCVEELFASIQSRAFSGQL